MPADRDAHIQQLEAEIHLLSGEKIRLRSDLEQGRQAVENWFAPWGSWKTAWWEDFASDDHAYSSENFIEALGRQLVKALAVNVIES